MARTRARSLAWPRSHQAACGRSRSVLVVLPLILQVLSVFVLYVVIRSYASILMRGSSMFVGREEFLHHVFKLDPCIACIVYMI
jgi:hypothetical protein